jgi:aldehyde:ferredoxin oxidoreductase
MSEFGYAGEILKIDLTKRSIKKLATSNYASRFLGGRGIGAKLYWDETSAETGAFAPENCLAFISGPVAGFMRFSGCRWQICGKSPIMYPEAFSYANLGGSWGAWLKYAGFDGLAVTGKADRPVYLYIDGEGRIEIQEAAHLWGLTTLETQDLLQTEYGKEARVLSIGPAAERLVTFATLLAAENSSASSGFGAVMGSKNLKAIVVKVDNKKKPQAAKPDELQSLAKQVYEINTRNREEGEYKQLAGRMIACHGCISGCPRRTYEAENNHKFKSYCQASLVYLKPAQKYYGKDTDVDKLAERLCDKFGLDTIVMEPLITWLERCYRGGILSETETGLPLSQFGSSEFIQTLVRAISFREGFGDVLAKGILEAARSVGRGSDKYLEDLIATRAGETQEYDPRLMLTNALFYATEPRRPIPLLHAVAIPFRRWSQWHQGLPGSLLSTDIFFNIAKTYWGSSEAGLFASYEGKALAAKRIQDYGYVNDSIVLCDRVWPIFQVHPEDPRLELGTLESRIVSAITGVHIDESELLRIGERIFNLQRAILIRQKWDGRRSDTILDYFFKEPTNGVYFNPECQVPGKDGSIISLKGARIDRNEFEKMKDEYYSLRGWDIATGVPTSKKLHELDLEDVSIGLEKSRSLKER